MSIKAEEPQSIPRNDNYLDLILCVQLSTAHRTQFYVYINIYINMYIQTYIFMADVIFILGSSQQPDEQTETNVFMEIFI